MQREENRAKPKKDIEPPKNQKLVGTEKRSEKPPKQSRPSNKKGK